MNEFKKHIFLTGSVQIGKSTLIRSVIEAYPNKNIGGFFTRWIDKGNINGAGLYIFPCDKKTIPLLWGDNPKINSSDLSSYITDENLIATFDPSNYKKKIIYKDVFDTVGKKYIKSSKNSDLIIVDEIGIMEDKSYVFKDEVLSLLEGDTPILGVVRNKSGVLTNAVKNHADVEIIEVTRDNREKLKKELIEKFK